MFPRVTQGPIVRYADVEPQLTERRESLNLFGNGMMYFVRGLAKKVLLANNIGILYTTVSGMDIGEFSAVTAWLGAIAYTFQIYFDFSGYSDMAIGLGRMFGFNFMKNFDYPYISKSVTEFWRRWHISWAHGSENMSIFLLAAIVCRCRSIYEIFLLYGF